VRGHLNITLKHKTTNFFVIETTRCTNFINLVMKLYVFRTVRLSIIRSLFTVHSAMVYVIQVCRQLYNIYYCWVQWINCWWWTDELPETCRVSWQNKFVKLVHLVGFITKKFVTMQHGHIDVKKNQLTYCVILTSVLLTNSVQKPAVCRCFQSQLSLLYT